MGMGLPPVTINIVAGVDPTLPTDPFTSSLKTKSEDVLRGMLKDPTLDADKKKSVLNELESRAAAKSQSAQGTQEGADAAELQELLKKLKAGTIEPKELDKLAGMLGMTPEELTQLKGDGSGGTPPGMPPSTNMLMEPGDVH